MELAPAETASPCHPYLVKVSVANSYCQELTYYTVTLYFCIHKKLHAYNIFSVSFFLFKKKLEYYGYISFIKVLNVDFYVENGPLSHSHE